jgi:ABC-2 type transport system ATP-binding protein
MYEKTACSGNAIETRDLGKRYGEMWALRHLDLEVEAGTVLGLLGHNGAGKTTAIRLLTTLSTPSEGSAFVAGHDVVTAAPRVRADIGVAAQAATVDGLLTGRANLELIGRLYRIPAADARTRAGDLLERFGIADAADRLVKEYSGGMRRRLDLAASLIADPPVIFLDEPTTGLDPAARRELWNVVGELLAGGTTILLTTQYLDEADALADTIVVLDHGRAIASGTPTELKTTIGGERLEIVVENAAQLLPAIEAVSSFTDGKPEPDEAGRRLIVPLRERVRLVDVVRALDARGVEAVDVQRREATLDDVFLMVTGSRPVDDAPEEVAA